MSARFVLEAADALLDGGSIFLTIRDREGHRHELELVQSMFAASPGSPRLPGRLYVDGDLVEIRSERERQLLEGLKEASGSAGDVPGGAEFMTEFLRILESERYSQNPR